MPNPDPDRPLPRDTEIARQAARFIGQFSTGFGNYTDERDQFFDEMSVRDLATEIKRRRDHNET